MKEKIKKQKLAIVTGSSGAIGLAITSKLSSEGYKIIGIDIKPNRSKYLSHYLKFDLSLLKSDSDTKEFLSQLTDKIGNNKIDLLINNAAIQYKDSLNEFNYLNWEKVMSVNLDAPLLLIHKLKEKFIKHGLIINISSIHANLTKPGFLSYSVSKAALSSLTRSLAVNHGDTLRFVAIEPAAVETNMLKSGFGKKYNSLVKKLKKAHPTNSIAKPSTIAELVFAISSKALNFLNGSIIKLDGGISSRLHDPE